MPPPSLPPASHLLEASAGQPPSPELYLMPRFRFPLGRCHHRPPCPAAVSADRAPPSHPEAPGGQKPHQLCFSPSLETQELAFKEFVHNKPGVKRMPREVKDLPKVTQLTTNSAFTLTQATKPSLILRQPVPLDHSTTPPKESEASPLLVQGQRNTCYKQQ